MVLFAAIAAIAAIAAFAVSVALAIDSRGCGCCPRSSHWRA